VTGHRDRVLCLQSLLCELKLLRTETVTGHRYRVLCLQSLLCELKLLRTETVTGHRDRVLCLLFHRRRNPGLKIDRGAESGFLSLDIELDAYQAN
jgi:hypothetical protein